MRFLLISFILATASAAIGGEIDNFDSLDRWRVIASDGVKAEIRVCEGRDGRGLRLVYDFTRGAGFCVLRRDLPMDLPAEYRFGFQIRGESPPNNLEFKLIDPSGENVWWVNQRAFEFPSDWKKVTLRSRRFQFAWGPSGGKTPFSKLGAIEFAIAASSGGKGTIDLDQLTFEAIPPRGAPKPIRVSFGAGTPDGKPEWVELPSDWKIECSIGPPWPTTIALDLGGVREYGGLIIDWDETYHPDDLDIDASLDGTNFETVAQVRGMRGGRRYVQIPDGEAAFLRIRVLAAAQAPAAERPGQSPAATEPQAQARGAGISEPQAQSRGSTTEPQAQARRASEIKLTRLELAPPEFGQSVNAMWSRIARDAPRGWYPRYFLGEQQPWTVIGVEGDDNEALMDAAGAIELGKGGPRLEPFLFVDGKLFTWADVDIEQDHDPVGHIVRWVHSNWELSIRVFGDGTPANARALVDYSLKSRAGPLSATLYLAIRPFQVLPPWHELNLTGGVSRVPRIEQKGSRIDVAQYSLVPWNKSDELGASAFSAGDIVEYIANDRLPNATIASNPDGLASAALAYRILLKPESSKSVLVAIPLAKSTNAHAVERPPSDPSSELSRRIRSLEERIESHYSGYRLRLPLAARSIEDTFAAMQHYILINADGPRIQPGSRTYERSWIRDGALTGTALLVTGHGDKMRDFLDWYAPFQYESGKIPCVVDSRGPDPVPENDSHGEYIYAVATYYRFTHDREFLNRHYPRVIKAVEYIESLRAQRMTDEFKSGPVEKRMLYGLVPESISHEGYSAKPMHSYWDGFFTLRGLSDAAYLAGELNRTPTVREGPDAAIPHGDNSADQPLPHGRGSDQRPLAEKWQSLADDYRKCMYDSMRLTMDLHKIDYIPGCAELGDFDATSTAIGVFPCGERGRAPEPQLTNTFDRYLKFFRDRRDGKIEWREFTPYELRLVGVFVRLGRVEEAHELLDWFMQYQQPAGWRQWGEVAYRDPLYPGFVGDMPHTWVGGEFVNSVRAMMVYEDENADALIVAAGVPAKWLTTRDTVSFTDFPTEYGNFSASLAVVDGKIHVRMSQLQRQPTGGVILKLPKKPVKVEFAGDESVKYEVRPDAIWLQKPCTEMVIHVRE